MKPERPPRNELGALVEFPFQVAAEFVGVIEGMHQGIAGRAFKPLGLIGAPTRVIHDALSRGAYSGVRGAGRATGRLASKTLTLPVSPPERELSASRRGSMLVSALNGVVGDRFVEEKNAMAVQMAVRVAERDLPLDRDSVRRAFPRATPKLAIFVHGLCGDEHCWTFFSRRHHGRPNVSYGSQLRRDLGYTPVFVRYNTGLHISMNGRALSELIEQLVAAWPMGVQQIALFGHSMGGLVVRSACHYGDRHGQDWTRHVRHVFCLGSPHLGAPLEKGAAIATYGLALLPETRGFARFINTRSAGIKDLRFGAVVDEDWTGRDIDAYLRDACVETPFLASATYYFVAATVGADPEHPLSRTLGDLLVTYPSASGQGRRRRLTFRVEHGRHVGGMNHFTMLNHPTVYAAIREWLEVPPPRGTALAAGASETVVQAQSAETAAL